MNIYYIVDSLTGSLGNGITSQAMTWADILEKHQGIIVHKVNPWVSYSYKKGDIVHLFGSSGTWFLSATQNLKAKGCKVVWSPICDNIDNPVSQRLKTHLGSDKLQLYSLPMVRKKAYVVVDCVFVRSQYEKEYIMKAYRVVENKIRIVPLSISYDDHSHVNVDDRETFCLHISSISDERKNVLRLIKAAKKFGFRLVLAGKKGSVSQFKPLADEIGNSDNIEVMGFISEEQKLDLYRRAKVFALPSIKEGVGIVALDAAHFGCEVVITDVGGPKEYYGDLAWKVNPYSVDEIGQAILEAMTKTHQPALKTHVDKEYSKNSIADKLIKSYENLRECSH